MKPRIKLGFSDLWTSFNPNDNFFLRLIRQRFDVVLTDEPDFLIYGCYGRKYRRHDCVRIFYAGENWRPNWATCDYAVTFDHTTHPKHYRFPAYALYGDLAALIKSQRDPREVLAAKTGFCNFVYSNPHCLTRNKFFRELSKYKRVDSGGKVYNNVGGRVPDKLSFVRNYKFTIAFENESHPGYVTEKLAEPMLAGSLPIYWGNPLVHLDFNPRSFINAHDWPSIEALVERVIAVDRDDELYLEYARQPWYHNNEVSRYADPAHLLAWFERVFLDPQPQPKSSRPAVKVFHIDRLPDTWSSINRRIRRTARKWAYRREPATVASAPSDDPGPDREQKLVYDVGMNDGADTAYYLHRGHRVVAIEANPVLVEAAIRRFPREIVEGQLTILNVGIAQDGAAMPFWVCDDRSEWSSFDRALAARDGAEHHSISVPCCRFGDILAEYGTPHYLKIDIEGNDTICLQDLAVTEVPEHLSVEAGDVEILSELRALGYERFKCISQFYLLPMENPPCAEHLRLERLRRWRDSRNIAWRIARGVGAKHWLRRSMKRLRRHGDWVFPWGASGSFGADLPGRWLSFEEMRETYLHYQAARSRGEPSIFWHDSEYSFWCDFHAWMPKQRMKKPPCVTPATAAKTLSVAEFARIQQLADA